MNKSDQILNIIYGAIQELNLQLTEGVRLKEDRATIIVGQGGMLDSLSLISLLVIVERKLLTEKKITVSLLDELTAEYVGQHNFYTVGSLAAWILKEHNISKAD